ncbi:hypothetical protein GPECTOR_1g123 [Gonium pectorale]|uniref:Uncharacterized protein n=1 Tax=Gonium pectorale TaxID=33097 RepID=A0A150H262_GONPE|nr:hypothetical protein GPECTOR_1g123 [Gonium pectorale]|eukprot:KXZ56145.1 hypothetical protein GPECTOR_1g123 [Gonium pectorale]
MDFVSGIETVCQVATTELIVQEEEDGTAQLPGDLAQFSRVVCMDSRGEVFCRADIADTAAEYIKQNRAGLRCEVVRLQEDTDSQVLAWDYAQCGDQQAFQMLLADDPAETFPTEQPDPNAAKALVTE